MRNFIFDFVGKNKCSRKLHLKIKCSGKFDFALKSFFFCLKREREKDKKIKKNKLSKIWNVEAEVII